MPNAIIANKEVRYNFLTFLNVYPIAEIKLKKSHVHNGPRIILDMISLEASPIGENDRGFL